MTRKLHKTFLSQLTQRKVTRVALAYIVIGWLAMQVGEVTFEALNLPSWTLAAFIHADLGNSDTARDYFLHLLELDAASRFALRELATRDIAQDQWEIALERWRQAYPELVSADEPLVDRENLDVAVFFASNLLEAGQENEGLQLLNKCLTVALDMPLKSDSEYWASWIYVLMGDRDEALAGIRRSIIDGHKGVEGSFLLRPEYDFLRDEPEFQELMQIIKTDIDEQRERILEMERNGEMPPAPGVVYEFSPN
jgi:tetratricopeptide (TPR) repeat protein